MNYTKNGAGNQDPKNGFSSIGEAFSIEGIFIADYADFHDYADKRFFNKIFLISEISVSAKSAMKDHSLGVPCPHLFSMIIGGMNDQFIPQREITLRFLTQAGEVNFLGNIHGGAVMKWIDEAAYACAAGWCGGDCVTVYVGGIRFYQPIHVGSLVEVSAKLIYTGNTSMHIAVDVCAGDPKTRVNHKTTHCIIVYVAIDATGKPTAVPKWQPESAEDRALEAYALRLMELRQGIEAEMEKHMAEQVK